MTLTCILVNVLLQSLSEASLPLASAPLAFGPPSAPVFKQLWSVEGRDLQAVVRKGSLFLNGSSVDVRTGKRSDPKRFDIDIEIDRAHLSRSESGGRWSSNLFAGTNLSIALEGRITSDPSPVRRYSEDTLAIRSQSGEYGGTLDLNSRVPYFAHYQGIDAIRGNISDGFLLLRSNVEDRAYVYETILLTRPVKLSPLKMFHVVDVSGGSGLALGWRVADVNQKDEFGNDYWGSESGRVLSFGDFRTGAVFWAKPHIVWGGSLGDDVLGFTTSGKWVLIDRTTGKEQSDNLRLLTGISPSNVLTINSTLILTKHIGPGKVSVSGYVLEKL